MNNETHFFKTLKHITLRADAKARMREVLSSYADMHAVVPEPQAAFGSLSFMASARFPIYASFVALFIIGGSAVTLGAEGTVPGDVFYGIKVHVNEPLMSLAASGDTERARLATELAARRVDEAAVLAQKGELTEEKQAYLENEFSAEVARATEHTKNLVEKGNTADAETLRFEFQSTLATEAQALGAAPHKNEKTKKFFNKVLALSGGVEEDDSGTTTASETVTSDTTNSVALVKDQKHGTSTTATAKALAASKTKTRVNTLQVTASTSLRAILNTGSLPQIQTDRAPLSQEGHDEGESESAGTSLKLGD